MKKALLSIVTLLLGLNITNAQNCYTDWDYMVPVTISNSNADTLRNHQVKLEINTASLISDGKMNPDGSDIRFTIGCCEDLCFSVEDGMNTATTSIWVKVPQINPNNDVIIYMIYGNTAATDAADGSCTFDLYEDFEGGDQNSFTDNCGSTTVGFANGNMTSDWASSSMYASTRTFSQDSVYTVESNVVSVNGDWPGFYWIKETTEKSYGLMVNNTHMRISLAGGGTGFCQGHNWASPTIPYTGGAGIWSFTWIETGDIQVDFPGIGPMANTDATYAKDEDLHLGFGGIASGNGDITMDWIRVRKWAETPPTFSLGTEMANGSLAPTADFSFTNIDYDATFTNNSSGATSYSWDFGDGGTSTDENPTYIFGSSGINTVCLRAYDDNGCYHEYCEDINISLVGFADVDPNTFNIYPIPAQDQLTIESLVNGQYELINLTGKVLAKGEIQIGENSIQLENLATGTYLLRISNEEKVFSKHISIKGK